MEDLDFRTARLTDLAAIVGLLADDDLGRERETLSDPVDPCYVEAFAAIEADPHQRLVVVEHGDVIIGTLQLTFIPGLARRGAWRGQIEAVRIGETWRAHGIGQKMFEWAIAECARHGCTLVQLTTDKHRVDAHRFYEKLGFVASHEGYKLTL